MSSIGSPAPFFFGGAKSYEIERSLRFNNGDSHKLTRTFGTNTSNTTKTVSVWVKRGLVEHSAHQNIFSTTISGMIEGRLFFLTDDRLQFEDRDASGGTSDGRRITTQKFRDVANWYHIVLVLDSTESTEIDRAKIYVNGSQVTSFDQTRDISQNYSFSAFRGSADNFIGVMNGSSEHFYGYLAEFNFIDGQALTPASFGETSTTTGQWIPKEYTGTYGNNGFYLNFSDNSSTTAATLGKDSSGNDNNFTPSNFGATNVDAVKDTPTNNFCTLSPINDSKAGSESEGNLRYTGGSGNGTIAATFGISHTDTQGYYFEGRIISGNQSNRLFFGVGLASTNWIDVDARGAGNADSWVLRNGDGAFLNNGSSSNDNGATSVGQILQIAVKGSKIWVGTNNTWHASGDPSAGTNEKYSNISDTWIPVLDLMTNNVFQFNFGQDSSFSGSTTAQGNTDANGNGDFYYAPPTGFLALCSKNLPNPTIKKPTDYFNTILYTGNNNTSQNITGVGFQPDWVWVKNRDDVERHHLVDAVRGDNKVLFSNELDSERTGSHGNGNTQLNLASDGFNLVSNGNNDELNFGTRSYVAWNWNAGGSTVSNSDGTISSQVRASTTAGFSIVSYTGNGSNSQTVGHGLGVTPDLVILKDRDPNGITGRWTVLHSFDTSKNLELNIDATSFGHQGRGSVTGVSNTTFTLFGSTDTQTVNESGDRYIAYVFSEVAGYSKFGSYTANGSSSNGNFVFTGFAPAWVMTKRTNNSGSWEIHDNKRPAQNPHSFRLLADTNNTEATTNHVDFVSNGFKIRNSFSGMNSSSGDTYLYIAFASAPFKFANAR